LQNPIRRRNLEDVENMGGALIAIQPKVVCKLAWNFLKHNFGEMISLSVEFSRSMGKVELLEKNL
jgi:hypothetical protein